MSLIFLNYLNQSKITKSLLIHSKSYAYLYYIKDHMLHPILYHIATIIIYSSDSNKLSVYFPIFNFCYALVLPLFYIYTFLLFFTLFLQEVYPFTTWLPNPAKHLATIVALPRMENTQILYGRLTSTIVVVFINTKN